MCVVFFNDLSIKVLAEKGEDRDREKRATQLVAREKR